jgi:5-formyltetrahydrofolate cyclo-ligase
MSVPDAKSHLRQTALASRTALARTRGAVAALSLPGRVAEALDQDLHGITIASYWPIGSELDVRPAMEVLAGKGASILLPVVLQSGSVLMFRLWQPGQALDGGPFGTLHPPASAPTLIPQVILAPLLAFDRRGGRLGYGAGFYDRTLAQLRPARRIAYWGVGFDEQEVPEVPMGASDVWLDGVITDRRIIKVET